MTAQAGKDLLLKLDADATGAFTTVAGLRATRISLSTASIDITNADSPERWRELLAGGGQRTATLSGSGVFKDTTADASARSLFFQGALRPWQAIIPDFGTLEGPFQITALDYAGDHDGEATYELTLASAGALSFTAL